MFPAKYDHYYMLTAMCMTRIRYNL